MICDTANVKSFPITDTILYVSLISLFERKIKWNEYQSKVEIQKQSQYKGVV